MKGLVGGVCRFLQPCSIDMSLVWNPIMGTIPKSREVIKYKVENVETRARNCLCAYKGVILVFISRVVETMREINTKMTLEWVHKKFSMTIHTISYLMYYKPQNTIKKTIFTYGHHVSSFLLTFWWWSRLHKALWNLCRVIFNSLNIYYVYSGDPL